jgi:hypothetical protein
MFRRSRYVSPPGHDPAATHLMDDVATRPAVAGPA